MLCVVGRVLLRKVLTSYQSTLEEEQNQQLLVRLVLSQFQAQARERQALSNMASLLDEETGAVPKPGSASKRKLKKDRQKERAKSMAENAEEEIQEVPWEESQELSLYNIKEALRLSEEVRNKQFQELKERMHRLSEQQYKLFSELLYQHKFAKGA